MPAKKGFCWCLGSRAPPEISYGVENGGMTIKPIEVDLPMPQDEGELNAIFTELVDELGLDKVHREAMFDLPAEKKWQIYCSKKKEQEDPRSVSWPDYYIEQIDMMNSIFFTHNEDEEIENRTKLADNLKTALRTQPMSFVIRFIELDGLNCLLNFLGRMDWKISNSPVHTSVIGCVKALLNNSEGRAHVLAHPTGLNIIAQSLATNNLRAKVAVLEILGAVCLIPGGHRKVLQAMIHFQNYAGERTRFQSLMNDLDCTTGDHKDEVSLKTAIMSFINASLKYGPGQHQLEFRLHLRYELLMLGIQPIIDKLRMKDNPTLDRHIDFFEMVRNEDEKEFAKKFETYHVDTKSAVAMFDLIKKKLGFSMAYPHFLSILFHFLQLPYGSDVAVQQWQLVDRVVQQITLQTKDGDPDVAPLEIDVKKVVRQLANESAVKDIQQKLRDVQKENDEINSRLTKKERECDVKTEEKEELMSMLNKIKKRLQSEAETHSETQRELEAMKMQLLELQQMVELERAERAKLEYLVKTGSLPDDAKMDLALSNFTAKVLTPPTLTSTAVTGSAPAPPPPPPVPGVAAPAPPPPPPGAGPPPPLLPGAPEMPGVAVRKKNIPTSTQPLKSFNWAKLPDSKVKGTIWTEIDDTKMYKVLDLHDLERTFSAYQRQQETMSSPSTYSSEVMVKGTPKQKELSLVDGRRAQNCTILLSKLKMTSQSLAHAVLTMDTEEELPKDMCEQLLRFVPTPEEKQMLNEHAMEIGQMAKADRFLFEMSRIEHYEQKLKALCYKKKFTERMNECKPKVEAVLEASVQLCKSTKLRKVLEIVLAFGNYMNRGQRGNAAGFKVTSLNKIGDTKSSLDRKVTLLHYLVGVLEKQFPELLDLEEDLTAVRFAAKVNVTELENDVKSLQVGLHDIEKELKYQKKKAAAIPAKDKFVPVMSDFIIVASYNFTELEDLCTQMKVKYEKVLKAFGEDVKKVQADEFFGTFDQFISYFCEAKIENRRQRRMKEEEVKRASFESQQSNNRERSHNGRSFSSSKVNAKENGITNEKGEFDDLISALRTGDVFGEDMAKMKRNRRRSSSTTHTSRERVIVKIS
ncbi:hypothetical protein NP493_1306g00020 [Ridgeia piscesae]|uniref:Disheveled-associated activator of morphogenesis 1 n=1 Tax=Ridgeia piscesae TaxID=27915 RepID=A0AAD9K921_RIDPI|nr:hypothetical protein NP493_1306g00020 [Ridgeia piscesae]